MGNIGYSHLMRIFRMDSQGSFIDQLSRDIGMDPVEFRRRNAIVEGDLLPYGAHMNPSGLHEAIDKVAAAIEWGKEEAPQGPGRKVGKGLSLFWKAPAMPPEDMY